MAARQVARGALFLALGLLVPMVFHAMGLGSIFLPMHLPIMLAGLFCGPVVGAVVGAAVPLLSALLTGMPPLMPPVAQTMIFELAGYGAVVGIAYRRWRLGVYPSLLGAMLAGRLLSGLVGFALLPLFGLKQIPFFYPLTYSLVAGLPGVALQLLLLPAILYLLDDSSRPLWALRRTAGMPRSATSGPKGKWGTP